MTDQTSPLSAEQLWDEYCDQLEWDPSAQGAIAFAFERMSSPAQPTPSSPESAQLMAVYKAAHGLCFGYDWNKGTQALLHGYRRRLLDAVNAIDPVQDYESKCVSIANDADGLAQRPAVGPGVIERMVTDAWDDARREAIAECANIAEAIDSGRGNEKQISKAIRALSDTSTDHDRDFWHRTALNQQEEIKALRAEIEEIRLSISRPDRKSE